MPIKNKNNVPNRPLSTVTPSVATPRGPSGTTKSAVTQPPAASETAAAETMGDQFDSDAFENSSSAMKSFADGGDVVTMSGVRNSGVRQMASVLQTTQKSLAAALRKLAHDDSPWLEELVGAGFSDDALGATSEKSRSRRKRQQALRKRAATLRRRLKILGSEGSHRDPVSLKGIAELSAELLGKNGEKTSKNDAAMTRLRSGGEGFGPPHVDILRMAVTDGDRGADKATAFLDVLPGVTSSAFLADLLGGHFKPVSVQEPAHDIASKDVASNDTTSSDIVARYRSHATAMGVV